MSQTPEQRAEYINSLRSLIDLLETHEEIPALSSVDAWIFLHSSDGSTQAERFTKVYDVADIFGASVTTDIDGDRQFDTHIGKVHLYVCAKADKRDKSGKRVVTRGTDEALRPPLPAEHGECLDEQMRSVA